MQSYMDGSGYLNVATGFKTVIAVSASSSDTTTLNDSAGAANTLLAGTPYTSAVDQAIIEYTNSEIEAEHFPQVVATPPAVPRIQLIRPTSDRQLSC